MTSRGIALTGSAYNRVARNTIENIGGDGLELILGSDYNLVGTSGSEAAAAEPIRVARQTIGSMRDPIARDLRDDVLTTLHRAHRAAAV